MLCFARSFARFAFLKRLPTTKLCLVVSNCLKAAGGEGCEGRGSLGCSKGSRFFATGLLLCATTVVPPCVVMNWQLEEIGTVVGTTMLKEPSDDIPLTIMFG